jgi:hypothetical protein
MGVTKEDLGAALAPRTVAFAGPAGRPRRGRAEELKSESDRVRGKEVGMVSNKMEAGRHAQERSWARVRDSSNEGRAEASRAANRRSMRWGPHAR